jgi:hypothetical protein
MVGRRFSTRFLSRYIISDGPCHGRCRGVEMASCELCCTIVTHALEGSVKGRCPSQVTSSWQTDQGDRTCSTPAVRCMATSNNQNRVWTRRVPMQLSLCAVPPRGLTARGTSAGRIAYAGILELSHVMSRIRKNDDGKRHEPVDNVHICREVRSRSRERSSLIYCCPKL